jgi:hypothetical protein
MRHCIRQRAFDELDQIREKKRNSPKIAVINE